MTQPIIESLEAFRQWFLSPAGPGLLRIPFLEPTHHKDGLVGLTLYRRKGYQAELCLVPAETKFALDVPVQDNMIVMFLGGALEFDGIESPNPNDSATPSPDAYVRGIQPGDFNLNDPEVPHPLLLHPHSMVSMPLLGGTKVKFHSPKQDGVLLFFSLNTTTSLHSSVTSIAAVT